MESSLFVGRTGPRHDCVPPPRRFGHSQCSRRAQHAPLGEEADQLALVQAAEQPHQLAWGLWLCRHELGGACSRRTASTSADINNQKPVQEGSRYCRKWTYLAFAHLPFLDSRKSRSTLKNATGINRHNWLKLGSMECFNQFQPMGNVCR